MAMMERAALLAAFKMDSEVGASSRHATTGAGMRTVE